jgi:hypothetical protein
MRLIAEKINPRPPSQLNRVKLEFIHSAMKDSMKGSKKGAKKPATKGSMKYGKGGKKGKTMK